MYANKCRNLGTYHVYCGLTCKCLDSANGILQFLDIGKRGKPTLIQNLMKRY